MIFFNKIRRLLNGNWIDDLFIFDSHGLDGVETNTPDKPDNDCPYKVERFEGDCY
jgi:hypothetical protein